jgi:hypothetical protein
VLDLAARQVPPDAHRELDTVHRFTRTVITLDGTVTTVPDEDYAQLSLAMRAGDDPGAVFDALLARDQIHIHATDTDRVRALARHAVHAHEEGIASVVVADTNDQVSALNDAIRAELVAAGRVDDTHTTIGHASRVGAGDQVVTRRNDPGIEVANRDTWTVTSVHRDGSVTVTGDRGERVLPADYVRQHVELGYASTVHGVQGETAATAHLAVGEHTSAASAYVGMTRGRNDNTAHPIAESVDDAREQWVAVFSRDRADLGPAHAAELAAREAERYARLRPLEHVLGELRDAWTIEADAQLGLDDADRRRELLRDIVTIAEQRDSALPPLRHAHDCARYAAAEADIRLANLEPIVAAKAAELGATLRSDWDAQREPARAAAQTVRHGTGRLGQRRAGVRDARAHLEQWSTAWRAYLPHMPHHIDEVVGFAAWFDDTHATTLPSNSTRGPQPSRATPTTPPLDRRHSTRTRPKPPAGVSYGPPNSTTRWCSSTSEASATSTTPLSGSPPRTTRSRPSRQRSPPRRIASPHSGPSRRCAPNRQRSSSSAAPNGRPTASTAPPGWPSAQPSTSTPTSSQGGVDGAGCQKIPLASRATASVADSPCRRDGTNAASASQTWPSAASFIEANIRIELAHCMSCFRPSAALDRRESTARPTVFDGRRGKPTRYNRVQPSRKDPRCDQPRHGRRTSPNRDRQRPPAHLQVAR